jgi:hypothetical protein
MKKLAVLSLLKINKEKQLDTFLRCLNSYKSLLQNNDIEFLVVNESNETFRKIVNDEIIFIKKNTTFLSVKGMVNSVRELIKVADSKYIMFLLDDVELLFDPNISINDCISVMESDTSIDQIKFGGGKVYNSNEKKINTFKKTHKPIDINNNIIWLNESDKENPTYLISQWNSVTRSDTLKRLNKKLNVTPTSWDGFCSECSKIYKEENNKTKTGWLNLRCGLYAWGKTTESFENYKLNYDKNNRG